MSDDLIAQAREMQKRMIATTLPGELADALEAQTRRIAELEAALLRIGQPGKKVIYCRDGHEEAVLLARAAYKGEKDD